MESKISLRIAIFVSVLLGVILRVRTDPMNLPESQLEMNFNYKDMETTVGKPIPTVFSSDNPPLNFSTETCHLELTGDSKGISKQLGLWLLTSKLLEYEIKIMDKNDTPKLRTPNPLLVGNTYTYMPHRWSRVVTTHGQTILNLPFNYYIMSMMTLKFGIMEIPLELVDEPYGCLDNITEEEKLLTVLNLLLRDLDNAQSMQVLEGRATACHQVMVNENGAVTFAEKCCWASDDGTQVNCMVDFQNVYLNFLHSLLISVKFLVVLFGPLLLPDWVYAAAYDKVKYYVKLKKPLTKKIVIVKDEECAVNIKRDHTLDLRNTRNFALCKRLLSNLPHNRVIPVTVPQYNIQVSEKKLLTENRVQVGVIESVARAVFMCKLAENDAFKDCCRANLCGCVTRFKTPWISMCSIFGRILLSICLPIPFYIRLVAFYLFENTEIEQRQAASDRVGLPLKYEWNVFQYWGPTNPFFILGYCIYITAAVAMAFFGGTDKKTKFQQAVMDAFSDLNSLSMLNAVGVLVTNFLWPFTKYGLFGILIGIFVWPILLPISIFCCALYCIPIVFVSCRIFRHTFAHHDDDDEKRERMRPQPERYRAYTIFENFKASSISQSKNLDRIQSIFAFFFRLRFLRNTFLSVSAILALLVVMMTIAEVLHFFIQAMCYTLMGVIVNASTVLKYGSLIFLVVLYSYDCYNNVAVKYLKLNKALFGEIKFRLIKEIEEFTQLPSNIQENRGFKSVESSDQAEYETEDDITGKVSKEWTINDLILFIDKEDCPRIPKKLFEQVCEIKAAGSPGPVYLSLIKATKKFCVILFFLAFVFLVVLSFGQAYNVSQTNQALATMAGGFMPFMFRNLFKPKAPNVETGLLSFRSKLEEIIKNFKQDWHMNDFVIDIEEPKSEESEDTVDSKGKDDEKDKDKDKDKGKKDKEKDKDWLKKIQRIRSVNVEQLEKKLDMYQNLEVADGLSVDIVFIFTDEDIDWRYSNSDVSEPIPEYPDDIEIPQIVINGNLLNFPDHQERVRRISQTSARKMTYYDIGM